ncbi:BLUF domain-containing protein [Clavibacter michiganensis]|nr:BLUF domain-containing protein [Clavibacter michiganensis]
MIYTTIYVSTLTETTTPTDIDALLTRSRARNDERGISGMLLLRDRRVMQLLEGDEAAVRDLYSRISTDTRHTDVVTVWASSHEDRRFADWSMAFDDLNAAPRTPAAPLDPADAYLSTTASPALAFGDTDEYVERRNTILRRALVTGDQLVTALALILYTHRPEAVLDPSMALRCAECRTLTTLNSPQYPCPTARTAIRALEAALT